VSRKAIAATVAATTPEVSVRETDEDEPRNGEETIDDTGRNPTQRRLDEEGAGGEPVAPDPAEDEPWAS
jgi:hypothetical protein